MIKERLFNLWKASPFTTKFKTMKGSKTKAPINHLPEHDAGDGAPRIPYIQANGTAKVAAKAERLQLLWNTVKHGS